MKKVFIAVLFVIFAGEIIWGYYYLRKNKIINWSFNQNQIKMSQEPELTVTNLSLSPKTGTFKIGEVIVLEIKVDSKNNLLSGADAELFFDGMKINPLEIIPGKIFPDYPLLKIDKEKSRIAITGTNTNPDQKAFTGSGILATLKIKGLKEGETKLKFNFYPGATNDTNLVEKKTGKDILKTVLDGSYNFVP